LSVQGFGKDTSCTSSMRAGQLVSGARLIGEAAFRRITTPRGSLRGGEEEADYGIDILDAIGSVNTKSDAAALAGRIRNELVKDERIQTVDVTITDVSEGVAKAFEIAIELGTSAGPFGLAVAVDEVSVELLGIQEVA